MLSAVKNHFRFKEASFVGIKLENCLPSLCSNNIQIATCHLQLSFYKRSANSKNEEQILALERRTGFFGERRTIQRRNSLFPLQEFSSPRSGPCVPVCFSGHCDLAWSSPALRPLMLFSAMHPTEGGITSADAFRRLASYSALSKPQSTQSPTPVSHTLLSYRNMTEGNRTFLCTKDYFPVIPSVCCAQDFTELRVSGRRTDD